MHNEFVPWFYWDPCYSCSPVTSLHAHSSVLWCLFRPWSSHMWCRLSCFICFLYLYLFCLNYCPRWYFYRLPVTRRRDVTSITERLLFLSSPPFLGRDRVLVAQSLVICVTLSTLIIVCILSFLWSTASDCRFRICFGNWMRGWGV